LVGQREGHTACKTLGVGLLVGDDLTGAFYSLQHLLSLPLPSSLVSVKPANPGSPGKWLLKWRENYGSCVTDLLWCIFVMLLGILTAADISR